MTALPEQQPHLLLAHPVALGQVQAGQAGAEPAPRRLALLLVVPGEADLPPLGGVVDRDLLRQIRVPAARGELVQRHHAYIRRTSQPQGITPGDRVHQVCSLDLPLLPTLRVRGELLRRTRTAPMCFVEAAGRRVVSSLEMCVDAGRGLSDLVGRVLEVGP